MANTFIGINVYARLFVQQDPVNAYLSQPVNQNRSPDYLFRKVEMQLNYLYDE